MTPSPTAPDLHARIDSVIRRQQARLLDKQRERKTLTRDLEADICRSIGWIGHDLHEAIEEVSTEATHAPVAVR